MPEPRGPGWVPGTLASGRVRMVLLPLLSCLAGPFLTPAALPVCTGLRISATLCAGYSCASASDLPPAWC